LAKTAAERFVSCEQFAAAVRQAVGSDSTSIQPTQAAIPPAPPLPLARPAAGLAGSRCPSAPRCDRYAADPARTIAAPTPWRS
jgi:hypothetical protein